MKTIILNQRKERDELMSRPYLIRKSIQDTDLLLSSHLIKLITGPRRVGKSTQALLMLRDKNFAYLNFDNYQLLETWDANLVMRISYGCWMMSILGMNISCWTRSRTLKRGICGSVNYIGWERIL